MKRIILVVVLALGISTGMRAQVTIGSTSEPDGSAVLDLNTGGTNNKGLLLPTVKLKNATDKTIITSPATGLMVYADGTGGLPAGVYVWNETKWVAAESATESSVFLTPSSLTFEAAAYGSTPPAAQTVKVVNTGTQATGALTLGGDASTNYTLSPASTVATIAKDAEGQFTVRPKSGLNAGTYSAAITVSNTNVPEKTVNVGFTVNQANQTISGLSAMTKTVGEEAFDLSATASSGLAVTYTSGTPAVATVSGKKITIVGEGTSTITAKQAGNANYNAAPDKTAKLTVNKKTQTITASTTALSKTMGTGTFTWTGTASSGLTVTYSSTDPTVATISSAGLVTLIGTGTCYLQADQAGNATYSAAPQVQVSLAVTSGVGPGTDIMGTTTYDTYCYPSPLGCWTDNSKEGSPAWLVFPGQSPGARGYYYAFANRNTACSGDYVVPTWAQMQALDSYLTQSGTAAETYFWTRDGAKAGQLLLADGSVTGDWGGAGFGGLARHSGKCGSWVKEYSP